MLMKGSEEGEAISIPIVTIYKRAHAHTLRARKNTIIAYTTIVCLGGRGGWMLLSVNCSSLRNLA